MNPLLLVAIAAVGLVAVVGGILMANPDLLSSGSTSEETTTTTTTTTLPPEEMQTTTTTQAPTSGFVPTVS